MKVSEKSLELNVGAELLDRMRNSWGMPKAYLRGLTQREEKQEGVDFFGQLDPNTRVLAFQFKAPRGAIDSAPYRYTLNRDQHNILFALAQRAANSVFYVFPFYITAAKLHRDVPLLLQDTWLLNVNQLPPQVFGTARSKVVRCQAWHATVNPEFRIERLSEVSRQALAGVPAGEFAAWYKQYRVAQSALAGRRNPWLSRSLRVAILLPGPTIRDDKKTCV